MASENDLLRALLFRQHSCPGKYGDDGEMQCNSCMIDFKRDTANFIHSRLMDRGKKLMREIYEGLDKVNVCKVPPLGWYCTRKAGHDGPCAAHPVEEF